MGFEYDEICFFYIESQLIKWTRANSEFTVISSSCISFPEQNIFVSSANRIVDNLVVELIRSFIYISKIVRAQEQIPEEPHK